MKFKLIFPIIALVIMTANAQDQNLPYYEIPDYPESYNACTVAARMIDGLGFRYYWATEGLTEKDLAYKPSESGRSTDETLDHLYGLSNFIVTTAMKKPVGAREENTMTYAEKRAATLRNFKTAADILRNSTDLSQFKIVISRGENMSEFPFWNNINGPIADAIWHCGQVVVLRRASGNPFNSKVSVFTGTVRN
ncbi:MAG: hypothetical protein KJO00_06160 [Bacteroidia bacterium]|nr:hypothetical protein [Bacteroidia bacterium]NNK74082.1 hypothetical protein [Flavobacteriaceae bacterium]